MGLGARGQYHVIEVAVDGICGARARQEYPVTIPGRDPRLLSIIPLQFR